MGTRPAILVDTNIIIEAVRVGAWERLRAHENLVTVRRCCDEALSGIPGAPGRVPVTEAHLAPPLSVVTVTGDESVYVAILHPDLATLDAGERELLTHAFTRRRSAEGGAEAGGMGAALRAAGLPVKDGSAAFQIACADQAAVRVAISMGLGDLVVSLEEILKAAGVRVEGRLKGHYMRRTLTAWKTKHALGI